MDQIEELKRVNRALTEVNLRLIRRNGIYLRCLVELSNNGSQMAIQALEDANEPERKMEGS